MTVDLATHDVDILCAIAGERPARVSAETAQRIHADHEDLLFGLMSSRPGTVAMLDVDWLTPAKRRQLTVVGEEGMFELDYLTPAADVRSRDRYDEPAADRRLRTDLRGRDRRAAGRDRRAARRRARGVRAGRPRAAAGRSSTAEDGRWAVVLADALLTAARERRTVELVPA